MSELLIVATPKHDTKHHSRKKQLHHLEIHAGEGATHDDPSWVVAHDFGPEHEPETQEFSDHQEMLAHVAKHSGTESA